jgi:hypothetical protein
MKPSFLPCLIIILSLFASCKARWSEEDKSALLKNCIEQDAPRYGFSDPEKHCDCIVKKIISRYPNPNQFENMELGEYGQMVAECQGIDRSTKVIWAENKQQAFVDSCRKEAAQQKRQDPAGYCKCLLNSTMNRYPTNDSLEKMDPRVLLEIARGCE